MVPQVISHYRILGKFGAGAMGEVYRAEDLKLHRQVAVKAVRIDRAGNTASNIPALREAIALSQIDHPNVVKIFDVVEEGDYLYLIMECAQGKTLRALLMERRPSLDEALRIAVEVATGLKAVHAAGEVHRDIKPENIMITPEGTCKILDFGIAHLATGTTITFDGAIVGTLHYMSPEQARGVAVDPRADIYSLGVLIYELLAGQVPFADHAGTELLADIVQREPVPLSRLAASVPPDLERVVAQAMAKDRGRRYPAAADLKHDLELVRERLSASGRRSTRPPLKAYLLPSPTSRLRRATPVLAALLACAVVVYALRDISCDTVTDDPPRVMVAPFTNTRGDADLAWLSGGIMDCLIAGLGSIEGYEIVHRHTVTSAVDVAPYQAAVISDAVLLGVAQKAGASYLVTGSFTASGAVTRITCELQDLRNDRVLASRVRDLTNLEHDFFPAVDAIADDVARSLQATRSREPAGSGRGLGFDTQSVAAMRAFEEGIEGFERGDMTAAHAAFRAAVAADSLFARAYLYLGLTAPEMAESRSFLTEAMAYRHGAPSPTRELVEAKWNDVMGRNGEATVQYERILAVHPGEMLARNSLANLYMRRREWAKAIAEFNAARARNPFDYSYFPSLTVAYVEIGRREEAMRLAHAWREHSPREGEPLQWVIQLNQTFGNYLDALDLCDSLAAIAPGADLPDREGILILLGRLAEAERSIARWQEEPGTFSRSKPPTQLALIERERRRFARGVELSRRAVAMQDDYYNRWIAGQLAAAHGDFAAAEEHARAIAAGFGGDVRDSTMTEALDTRRFYYNLEGEIALARGDSRAAVAMHERALRYASQIDDPPFRTPFAVALLAAGDTTRAIAAFERVLDFNPNYPEALLGLARAACARGDRPRARAALERLAPLWSEADPDFAPNLERNELIAALDRG